MLSRKVRLIIKKIVQKLKETSALVPDFFHFLFSNPSQKEGERIVFVGTLIHGRIARIAKWLKRTTSKEIIFICSSNGYREQLNNNSFDEVYTYKSTYGLRNIIKQFDTASTIFHTFGPPYEAAEKVVRYTKHSKTVFDFQDLLITNFGLNPPFAYMKRDMVKEKYVLKNVDGIVNHSLELQTAKKYYGDIPAKKLFFPNYVDNDFLQENSKALNIDTLSIVYVGSIMSDYRNKDYFGGQMLHWLIHKMEKQKIHFHIYPSPTLLAEHIIDYVELDRKYDYFHLHLSVPQEVLAKELKQYDFGVIPFFHRTNKKLNDKRWYSTTLKMFNFFEAGLPIIIGEDVLFQNFMGSRYGGSIKATWEDFDDLRKLVSKSNHNSIVNSIKEKRETLSIKNKINRLSSFYGQI
jgi:hypothetical protein